jgi:hypothetical protein
VKTEVPERFNGQLESNLKYYREGLPLGQLRPQLANFEHHGLALDVLGVYRA